MKIGVWYHCVLNGPRIPSEDNAILLMADQMKALRESGLSQAADQIHIGLNGGLDESFLVEAASQFPNARIYLNPDGQSELSTLRIMRDWLSPGWAVLYHHMKGVQHSPGSHFHEWRKRMERVCVYRWRECVQALEEGYDTAGTGWNVAYPGSTFPPGQRYWKGNFWWARSEYLAGLQPLVEAQFQNRTEFENRYEAEVWIGKCSGEPRVKDIS